MYRNTCVIFIIIFLFTTIMMNAQSDNVEKLKLKDAIEISLKNNPELKVIKKEFKALEAVKVQAGLYDNPEIEFSAENILGSNDYTGLKGAEISAQINQNILLAGKINKRIAVADKQISAAKIEYEIKRLEIISRVRGAFYKALSLQSIIDKNSELITISKEFINNLKGRVKAGKISPAEVSRANLILIQLKLEISRLQSLYETSLSELTSLMYVDELPNDNLEGKIKTIERIPSKESVLAMLSDSPLLKKIENEFGIINAQINLEEANAIPDITVSAGYKRLNEVKANTFIVGASIPLPIFNRNEGTIEKNKIRLDQKKIEYQADKNKLKLRVVSLYNQLKNLLSTAQDIKTSSIPQAEDALSIISEGNLVGRFAIIDVLDAQKSLFEIQNQYLNVLTETIFRKIELENILGKELD